jgi:hypothetical protein
MPFLSNGLETHHTFLKLSCANLLAIGQACRLLTVRRGPHFGDVASIGLPITNHFSPITLRRANACSGQASHLPVRHSPATAWPPPDDVGSRRASGPAGALLGSALYTFLRHRSWPICGTFGAARHLDQISAGGFENQDQSMRVPACFPA